MESQDIVNVPPPQIAARVQSTPKASVGFGSHFQSVRMIVGPLILAVPPTALWHVLYMHGIHSTPTADEPVVNAILPILASIHVFISGFLCFRESGDIREMKRAIRNRDKESFLEISEDRIPIPLKYTLFVSANLILGWTISLNYEVYWTGFASVVSVGYMLALIWEVMADFDDPVNGVWVIKDVPPEWIQGANIKTRLSDRLFESLIGMVERTRNKLRA